MSRHTRSHRRARWVLGIALTSLMVGSFAWAPPASADTITVNTTDDQYDSGAECSLREATVAASTDSAFGGCPAGAGADIISLSAGVYRLAIQGTDENSSVDGDLDIFDGVVNGAENAVTVQGAGMNATIIDGNGFNVEERVFDIRDGEATFADLTVRHGNGLEFGQRGGGIFGHTFDETLTILRSSVHDNDAACRGGGVAAGSGTILEVIDSEISDNHVPVTECSEGEPSIPVADGGGIYASGPYSIQNSTISDNYAFQRGGGIYAPNGFFGGSITNSTVSGNEVVGSFVESDAYQGAGGGMYIGPDSGLLERATASQQSAVTIRTPRSTTTSPFGAAACSSRAAASIDVIESTFSNNEANDGRRHLQRQWLGELNVPRERHRQLELRGVRGWRDLQPVGRHLSEPCDRVPKRGG